MPGGEGTVPNLDLGLADPLFDALALEQLDGGDVPDLLAKVDEDPVAPVPERAEAVVVADDAVDGLVRRVGEVVGGGQRRPHGAVVPGCEKLCMSKGNQQVIANLFIASIGYISLPRADVRVFNSF